MKIINVKKLELDPLAMASGTRDKSWLNGKLPGEQEEKSYLFKKPKYTENEIWAEKLSAELGRLAGFPVMNVYLAQSEGERGVLMESFIEKDEEFIDGASILVKKYPDYQVGSVEGYHLERVKEAFTTYATTQDFVDMCVFDAWIAGTDRHCENWGFLKRKKTYRTAPFFDNGNALGFNVSEEQIDSYFKDPDRFDIFNRRTKFLYKIGEKKKRKASDVLSYLRETEPALFEKSIQKVRQVKITSCYEWIDEFPEGWMSDKRKRWLEILLEKRWNQLVEY